MNLEDQWLAFGAMFASGCLLGVLLDLYRVLKRRWKLTGWVVALVDLCYWILAAGWIFSVLIWSTWGELRFYLLLSLFAGIGLYYWWFSRPTISVLLVIIQIVQAFLRFFANVFRYFIWRPIVFTGAVCGMTLKFFVKVIYMTLRGILWLLRPLWRPFAPLVLPVRPFLVKFLHFPAGIWSKMKNVLQRKGKG